MFSFSAPTNSQIKKAISRIVGVFAIAFFGSLLVAHNIESTAALHAAWLAGITAVYQVVESFFTTL